MMTDNIADCLTRVRNAASAQHDEVRVPHSKMKQRILEILRDEGMLRSVEVVGDVKQPSKKEIVAQIALKKDGKARLKHVRRVSTPGQRVYIEAPKTLAVRSGLGFRIISTSKGVMTDREALEKKVGGELLAELW